MFDFSTGRIVVTGAAGFIGSALIWRLNELGFHRIVACDRGSSPQPSRNLEPLSYADYIAAEDLLHSSLVKECSAIVHLGACSSTMEDDVNYLLQNNYHYTRQLAENALTGGTRFLYASSAATYGSGASGMSDTQDPLELAEPLNPYARSKYLFDCFAARAGFLNDIAGLKYFNVFGPNEGHKGEMRSFVAKGYEQATSTGSVSIFKSHDPRFADGEQERDFIYVKDAVDITIHLLHRGASGGLYNVGTGIANTWNEIARCVFGSLGLSSRIEYLEMPRSIRDNYQYSTQANTDKLRASGYKMQLTPFNDAINDYISNYLTTGRTLGAA